MVAETLYFFGKLSCIFAAGEGSQSGIFLWSPLGYRMESSTSGLEGKEGCRARRKDASDE